MPRHLVIFPGALGDLICVGPALDASRRGSGEPLELMARAELAQFAVGRLAEVARAHSIDRREVAALFREGAGAEGGGFFAQFDRIMSFFAADDERFRRRLAEAAPRAALTFHPFRPEGRGHIAEAYLREVGADSCATDVKLTLLHSDLDAARKLIRSLGMPESNFVVMFPGSGSIAKNWPARGFVEVAERLSNRVLVVLGPAEENLEPFFHTRRIPLLSGLELGTVAALARLGGRFLGNDSGVSHLAAAAGARGVAIFGPSDPDRWRPLGDVRVIRREPIDWIEPTEVTTELLVLD